MGTEVNPFMVGDDVRLINQVSGWSRDEGIITSISFDGEFIRFQYRVFGYRYELYE